MSELSLGVLRQCFIIGIENVTPALYNVHRDLISKNLWERPYEIFVQKVEQLGRKFHAGGSTTTNDEGQQAPTLLVRRCREAGGFNVLANFTSNALSVFNSLQEMAILEPSYPMWVRRRACRFISAR